MTIAELVGWIRRGLGPRYIARHTPRHTPTRLVSRIYPSCKVQGGDFPYGVRNCLAVFKVSVGAWYSTIDLLENNFIGLGAPTTAQATSNVAFLTVHRPYRIKKMCDNSLLNLWLRQLDIFLCVGGGGSKVRRWKSTFVQCPFLYVIGMLYVIYMRLSGGRSTNTLAPRL